LQGTPEDRVVTSARREACWAVGMWGVAFLYTLIYCLHYGYDPRTPAELGFVLWFPRWVFWGIVIPWWICIFASVYFAFYVMGDEPLDREPPPDVDNTLPSAEVNGG
jgi:hypothetical protein